jgi:hypothetical protein
MNKQEIKNSFKGLLPRGFTSTIRQRVKDKTGISYSQSLISKVCDAEKTNWNADIITEALKLAQEENKAMIEIRQQAAAI